MMRYMRDKDINCIINVVFCIMTIVVSLDELKANINYLKILI